MAYMALSINSRVVATRDHVSCELEGEAVILNLNDAVYYGLNEVALAIWERIQEPAFVWEIRDEIVRQFQVESDSCEKDVLNLLGQLKDSSLLQIVSSSDES
jgi:Coenzyme PQQ synthesis protein D (PqqD)